MYKLTCNHYRDGTKFVEQKAKEKRLKLKLLVEITKNNIDFLNSLNYHEIRQLDGIRSNIGIFDKRIYMVTIFHKESVKPDQIFFSNFKNLVRQQRYILIPYGIVLIQLMRKEKI